MIMRCIAPITLIALIAATLATQIVFAQQNASVNVEEIHGYTVEYGSMYYGIPQKESDGYFGSITDTLGNVIGTWNILIMPDAPTANLNTTNALKYMMSLEKGVDVNSIKVQSYIIDGKMGEIGSCTSLGSNAIVYFAMYSPLDGVLCLMVSNNQDVALDLVSTIHITSNVAAPQNITQAPILTPSNPKNDQNPF
jgi:hypothetical protein